MLSLTEELNKIIYENENAADIAKYDREQLLKWNDFISNERESLRSAIRSARSAVAERRSKSTDTKTEEPTPAPEETKRRLSPNMIKGGGAALAAGLGGLALARYLRRRKKKAAEKKD